MLPRRLAEAATCSRCSSSRQRIALTCTWTRRTDADLPCFSCPIPCRMRRLPAGASRERDGPPRDVHVSGAKQRREAPVRERGRRPKAQRCDSRKHRLTAAEHRSAQREGTRTSAVLVSYYVYYRVSAAHVTAARQAVAAMLTLLEQRTSVSGRLLRRQDEPLLWMEVYEGVR